MSAPFMPMEPKGFCLRTSISPGRQDCSREGWLQPWVRVRSTETEEQQRLATMPPFKTINRADAIKPGATVLLSAQGSSRDDYPVLAFQRYGRGKSFAFTPQDSWVWQMHASIPVEDLTHENYWRQLLR